MSKQPILTPFSACTCTLYMVGGYSQGGAAGFQGGANAPPPPPNETLHNIVRVTTFALN